ncbi:MAG TPA: IclR family transcriptional regulator [Xanthobacteraceae bacterium]|nr:IclR family transcriptional regulator [Xanthobacteraceae bacterium]
MRKARQKGASRSRVLDSFAEFEGDKQFATTLARGLEILRCFTPEGPVLGNKDLAARTGLPKPTISRFTYTLSRLGYLKADHISSKYQLGPAVLAIGYPLLATIMLRQLARPAMKELADYAGGSVSMGIRDRLNVVYVETSRSSSMFSRQLSDIGLSQPIAATAIGRAYLAACAPADREAVLNEIRIKTPAVWERHQKKIMQSLADFERFGFCMSWGDLRRDVHAVGVPLRLMSTGEIVVFNCALQSFLVKPGQIRSDIGPRLAAMVRSLAAV